MLRRALASPALADTAVIINEIGEIAIDHHLVDFVDGSVVELPGGCLCCAVREDLARSLRGLLARREAGEIRRFRRIVIETTGLADPAPILYTLGADPVLDHCLNLARVVAVIDAVTGARNLDRFAEAARQAALADALVISKTDLAPYRPELAHLLDRLNPRAAPVVGDAATDPAALLFAATAPPVTPLGPAGPAAAAHTHGIDAFAVILNREISRLDFARALGGLARDRGTDLLRVKGIVRFADRPERPALVQAAQHAILAPEWLDGWPDDDRRSRLVFVVHMIPRAEISAASPPPGRRYGPPTSSSTEKNLAAAERAKLRFSQPHQIVGFEAEQVSSDRLVMLLAPLQLLRHGVDVAQPALERIVAEDRGGPGGVIGGVDDIARLVDGKSRGQPDRHPLIERQLPGMRDLGGDPSSASNRWARAADNFASACPTCDWTTLLSRRVCLAPRGILSRASSISASRVLRPIPSATPAKPAL